MTLSQIRSLKARLLAITVALDLELSSAARSYAYLERLILNRAVHKGNRKAAAACCLLLAVKATDSKSTDYGQLIGKLTHELSVSRKELLEIEFGVLAALKFRLQVPQVQFTGHLRRILDQQDFSNLQEYLGERMYQLWQENEFFSF